VAPEATADAPYEGIDGSGTDMNRILSLSDGVIAFAMTLLVVTLALPVLSVAPNLSKETLSTYLGELGVAPLLFIIAFLVVGSWWSAHHRLFSAIRRYDHLLEQLNLLVLLLVAFTPFLLALVFAYGPGSVADDSRWDARDVVALFALVEVATGAVMLAIWRHATKDHRLVDASLPADWISYAEQQNLIRVGVFGLSIAVAFVAPIVAELVWFGILFSRNIRSHPSPRAPPGAGVAGAPSDAALRSGG
jgi:uncharacterized membrane protein